MATCKDCLHYQVCADFRRNICEHDRQRFEEYKINPDGLCGNFKNKADVIELPFVAMVEQFIKNGKFDNKITAHNGKYAVVYIDKSKWNCPIIDITEQSYNHEKAEERMQTLKGGAE